MSAGTNRITTQKKEWDWLHFSWKFTQEPSSSMPSRPTRHEAPVTSGDDPLQPDDVGVVELAHGARLGQEAALLLRRAPSPQGLDGHRQLPLAGQLQAAPADLAKFPCMTEICFKQRPRHKIPRLPKGAILSMLCSSTYCVFLFSKKRRSTPSHQVHAPQIRPILPPSSANTSSAFHSNEAPAPGAFLQRLRLSILLLTWQQVLPGS